MSETKSPEFWGKHFLLDCFGCNKERITSKENIAAFTKTLVERIDMKAYGDPQIEHFATHDPSKGGYTLCQMIETSLIDGHFVDETGDAYISVHSCKEFEPVTVIETVREFFQFTDYDAHLVYRGLR